jgi:hypothetical protein
MYTTYYVIRQRRHRPINLATFGIGNTYMLWEKYLIIIYNLMKSMHFPMIFQLAIQLHRRSSIK